METGSQILQYTGNANLGLGSNASIPAIDSKANLDVINETAKNISLMNHANNIKLYEQKVKDRDTTLDLLAQGQISSGNIDPNDRPAYDAAKKEAQDSFYKMIQNGGLNNPQAVREYQDKVTNLKNTAIWAQHRQLGFTKLDQEAAQQTLPEDIAAYKKLREDAKKLSFWNQIPIHQKAFDYNINNIWNQALGLPTTASQLATPDNQTNQTAVTEWQSTTTRTDKDGNIIPTTKTTIKTAPVGRSGLITNTKGGKGITTTGTQINKDGSLSEISYTPEKYWDLPTILDNVMDLSATNEEAAYSYEKYKEDFDKLPTQQKIDALTAKNNRLAQYSQQRGLAKPEQIKFYVDQTGQVIIQETKESFAAKTALASINGDYVEKPQAQVDYKIAEINKDITLQKMRDATTRRGQDLDYKVQWKNAETSRMNALKPNATDKEKFNANIQSPAILFGQHIDRVKNFFDKNPQKDLSISYSGTDAKTRLATGLQEGETIVYRPDGSYLIKEKVGTQRIGTIEDLKQGFMNAIKSGLTNDGSQTEGFQTQAEEGFDNIFGTRSGDVIFKGWGKKQNSESQKSTKIISIGTLKSLVGKKGYEGYSEQEIIDYYKSNGYEVKK